MVDDGEPPVTPPAVVDDYELTGNFPNPFNPGTEIRLTVSSRQSGDSRVRVTIYDALGHRVRQLFDGALPAGTHRFYWDGSNDRGHLLSSGIYLYEMSATAPDGKHFRAAKKMLLIR